MNTVVMLPVRPPFCSVAARHISCLPLLALLALLSMGFAWPSATAAQGATTLVTKRFGEQPTCDVTGASRDIKINSSGSQANTPDGTSKVHYYRNTDNGMVFYFDLSSIPKGAVVRKAVFRFFYDYDFYDGGKQGVSKILYMLTDPDGTGMWDEAAACYNKKKADVPWSSKGNIQTVIGDPIGTVYFRNWVSWFQYTMAADITAGVQAWVNDPAKNMGFLVPGNVNFNKRIAAREHDDPLKRPYLEVTYEGVQDEVIPPPTALRGTYYKGQTFLTWTEASTGKNETSYRIYRSSQPITTDNLASAQLLDQVLQGSSYLSDSVKILQPDLSPAGVTLAPDSGLYVYPVEQAQQSYYAVTTVVEGNENRVLTSGQNATAMAVSEQPGIPGCFFFREYYYYQGYVMWLGNFNPADPSDTFGFDNRRSAPFFFSVSKPDKYNESGRYPLTLYLHAWSHNYFDSGEGHDNSLYVDGERFGGFCLGINDQPRVVYKDAGGTLTQATYLEIDGYGSSYYAGWNSNYVPTDRFSGGVPKSFASIRPFEEGLTVPYTEKAIMFLVDWMQRYSPWAGTIDPARVYATGSSMGGGGAMALGLHYPDKFAALNSIVGRSCLYYAPLDAYGRSVDKLFGLVTMNLPMPGGQSFFDYMNLPKYLAAHPEKPYPVLRMINGKKDTNILWNQNPPFYQAANAARLGLIAYFTQRDHNTEDPLFTYAEHVDDRKFVEAQNSPYFTPFHYRLDSGFLAFSDFSLNDNPGSGDPADGDLRGGINRFPSHGELTETSTTLQVEVFMHDNVDTPTATVTITPRRLQRLAHAPGTKYTWIRAREGQELERGSVTADAHGLISIQNFTIEKQPAKLALIVGDDQVLPTPTPTPVVSPTPTPWPTPDPTTTQVPSRYLIEKVENVPLSSTTHMVYPMPSDPAPAKGVPFVLADTWHRVTRVSDVGEVEGIASNYPYDGFPDRGMTNGYSKYTCVNATGEYALAYGVQPWINAIYRVSDCHYVKQLLNSAGKGIGETNDIRWDLSGAPGTQYTIYYTAGSKIYKQDVLAGPSSEEVLYDFGANVIAEDHMDQATTGDYRAVILDNNTTVVFDLKNKRVLSGILPGRGQTDVSISGKWMRFDGFTPNRFYRISDLAQGDTTKYVELPTSSHGHDGWAFDRQGSEVYVFQDNQTDWISAFNPETRERINVINLSELGYDVNQHMGRIHNVQKKGWLLMATYSGNAKAWSANQIMLIEILPATQHPRIWRIASTCSKWNLADSKVANYFAEAFASMDPAGNNIYWGSNWKGQDNLELYRVELPTNWQAVMDGTEPIPTPTPTPTPTPEVTPTPTPEATPTPTPTPQPTPVDHLASRPPIQLDYADTLSAPVGAWVTLWGISFGPSQAAGTVSIGSIPVTAYASWSDSRIDFQVPAGAQSGSLVVNAYGQQSNALAFTVRPGRIYYVNPLDQAASDAGDGSASQPWRTLGQAAQTLGAGDTVYIASATYNETLEPLQGGTAELPIMYKALPGQLPVLDGTGLSGARTGLLVDGGAHSQIGYLSFVGLQLKNFAQSVQMIQSAHHCSYLDLNISNGESGFDLSAVNNVLIAQSRIHHHQQSGVRLSNACNGVLLRDCESDNNGITAGDGFEADQSNSGVSLSHCRADSNGGEGFNLCVDGLVLSECAAQLNATAGIHLWRNAHVQNTWVYSNRERGILCGKLAGESPRQEIINCTVAGGHSLANIDVLSGVDISILNTISVGGQGPAVRFADVYDHTVIDYSILQTSGPAGTPVIAWGAQSSSPLAIETGAIQEGGFSALTGLEATLLVGIAPEDLFENYAQGQLRLAATSAARTYGTEQNAPEIDYSRLQRLPANGLIDAGAYAYAESVNAADAAWSMYQ